MSTVLKQATSSFKTGQSVPKLVTGCESSQSVSKNYIVIGCESRQSAPKLAIGCKSGQSVPKLVIGYDSFQNWSLVVNQRL